MKENYIHLKEKLQNFEAMVSRINLKIKKDGSIDSQITLIKSFLADLDILNETEMESKWLPNFNDFYKAEITVDRISRACIILAGQMPEIKLKKNLQNIVNGKLSQDFIPDSAKDFFYELELGAALVSAGFKVELLEPDLIIQGNGLGGPIGFACKYPSSPKTIHDHISKGYKQLSNACVDGLVVIGLDLQAFDMKKPYLDFRGEVDPLMVFQNCIKNKMINLVAERAADYPSEKPIDGCMLTLSAYGAYGNPAGIVQLFAAQLQCDSMNKRFSDYSHIANSLNKITSL